MRFGVREICNCVYKAKSNVKIGTTTFKAGQPVLYIDTAKASSIEESATTVYAQGGRGNVRLIAWEGEKTVTFTVEDALLSPVGLSVLSGAGLIKTPKKELVHMHVTTTQVADTEGFIDLRDALNVGEEICPTAPIFVVLTELDGSVTGDVATVTNIGTYTVDEDTGEVSLTTVSDDTTVTAKQEAYYEAIKDRDTKKAAYDADTSDSAKEQAYNDAVAAVATAKTELDTAIAAVADKYTNNGLQIKVDDEDAFKGGSKTVFVDYYVTKPGNTISELQIDAGNFAGYYYVEASTLFRTTEGKDLPAEITFPNVKIQSNFTFSMAATGDPSTFTFTMDAFPGYTYFDRTKKVLCVIQVVDDVDVKATDPKSVMSHRDDEKLEAYETAQEYKGKTGTGFQDSWIGNTDIDYE